MKKKILILLLIILLIIALLYYFGIERNFLNRETNSKKVISDVNFIALSVLDENSSEGIMYKENIKITDRNSILEITKKINDCQEYPEFDDDFGAGGFFEGSPTMEVYENNGNKKFITVCDNFAQNERGFFNLMMIWEKEDGSDKTMYKVNQKLETYLKQLYDSYEL